VSAVNITPEWEDRETHVVDKRIGGNVIIGSKLSKGQLLPFGHRNRRTGHVGKQRLQYFLRMIERLSQTLGVRLMKGISYGQ
jgi:hypothetical protein